MKKILYLLLSLSIVSLLLLNMVSAKADSEHDLFKMADILKDENILIKEWSIHARQKVKSDKTVDLLEQYPDLDWKISRADNHLEKTAIISEKKGVKETLRILSAATETYIIYEVNGTGWGEDSRDFLEENITERISSIFHRSATIFSCITGEIDDKMYRTLPLRAKAILKAFQANELEKIEENSFVSATAYSPLFKESIVGSSGAMNLQVGIREEGLGGKTTIVVGTPIITIEY